MSSPEPEYQVALSFAGEQRGYVKAVASALKRGVGVFYDEDSEIDLWGKNLEVIPGEDQPTMMRGDAPNKAQHADGQKHRADCQRNLLHRRAEFRHWVQPPGQAQIQTSSGFQ